MLKMADKNRMPPAKPPRNRYRGDRRFPSNDASLCLASQLRNVVDLRLGAELLEETLGLDRADELRNLAVRIVEVAEDTSLWWQVSTQ